MKLLNAFFNKIRNLIRGEVFINIAEGTHAGHISMLAKGEIPQSNLLVKFSEGGISLCGAQDAPLGVCTDMGDAGEVLDVALPACAESTILCVASSQINQGDNVYTSASGKVSAIPSANSYKVGLALNSTASEGIVEIDPQNFGSKAYQIFAGGTHTWAGGSALTDEIAISSLKAGDSAFAVIADAGTSSATSVKASVDSENSKITFTLNQNGANDSTLINWLVVRNA